MQSLHVPAPSPGFLVALEDGGSHRHDKIDSSSRLFLIHCGRTALCSPKLACRTDLLWDVHNRRCAANRVFDCSHRAVWLSSHVSTVLRCHRPTQNSGVPGISRSGRKLHFRTATGVFFSVVCCLLLHPCPVSRAPKRPSLAASFSHGLVGQPSRSFRVGSRTDGSVHRL